MKIIKPNTLSCICPGNQSSFIFRLDHYLFSPPGRLAWLPGWRHGPQVGIRYDKLPGEWYGPTTAACVLRDISELYAARLSRPTATTRWQSRGSPCDAPPPEPPQPPSSRAERSGPAASAAAPLDSLSTTGDDVPAEGGREGAGTTLPPQEEQKELEVQVDGRDTERPDGGGASLSADREGGGVGCDGGGDRNCGRSGGGDGEGEGEGEGGDGVVSTSARALRVFVSQGDVVYIDEVEAVAIRGGDDDAAVTSDEDAAAAAAANGHTCGEKSGEMNGTATGKSGGQTAPSVASVHTAVEGEGVGSPAFFDPLLNPGSSGGQNQQGKAWSSSVLLLVPLRLGLDELSASYIPSESHYAKVGGVGGGMGVGWVVSFERCLLRLDLLSA